MSKPRSRGVPRTQDGKLNDPFQVRFVERRYDGSPRWYNTGWEKYVSGVPDDRSRVLDREKIVRAAVDEIHEQSRFYGDEGWYLLTCIKPDCALRGWEAYDFAGAAGDRTVVVSETRFDRQPLSDYASLQGIRSQIGGELKTMVAGYWDSLKHPCPECGSKRPLFAIEPILRKWIYVLQEAGQTLKPVQEIYAETDVTGRVYTAFENGRFNPKKSREYEGYLDLPELTEYTWHFFLSPKRLGPKALELLCRSPQEQARYDQQRERAAPSRWKVPVLDVAAAVDSRRVLQPWAATVKRRFSQRQMAVPYGEYVPLVDPFAWVASAIENDYYPALLAQRILATDENEQSKAFIAATLAQGISYIGEHELKPVPPSCSSSRNIAQAWVDRYEKLTEYLAHEVHYAYCRAFYPAIFGPGHRIVELSCQEPEHLDEPEYLEYGLRHWLHLLLEAGACRAGKIFTKFVIGHPDLVERIPRANVIRGQSLGKASKYASQFGNIVPVQLFALLAGALIAESSKPENDLKESLKGIGVDWSPGDNEWDAVAAGIERAGKSVTEYSERADGLVYRGRMSMAGLADSLHDRMMLFSDAKGFAVLLGIGVRCKAVLSQRRAHQTMWEKFDANRAGFEAPVVAAQFFLERMKARAERELVRGAATLETQEIVTLAGRRAMSGRALAYLAGPIGVLIALMDLISESCQGVDAAQAGDTGAMLGHGIMAAGALLGIAPAVAGSVALLTGAEVAAWAGPVGLIAAVIMAAGAIVLAFLSKNDLEMFALHCFLGLGYGQGDWQDRTGKAWMSDQPWPALRYLSEGDTQDAPDCLRRQRAALMRMFCNFEVYVTPVEYCGGTIRPALVHDFGIFEVEAELRPAGHSLPVETHKARIYAGRRSYEWMGDPPAPDSKITFHSNIAGTRLESIHVQAVPTSFTGPVATIFRVRLLLDPAGEFALPAKGWVQKSTYHQGKAASADVD